MANRPVGRPRIELNPDQIKALASIGLSLDEIARVFGCSHDTLERNYHEELEAGWAEMDLSLKRAQYVLAVERKHPGMLIWLGKQRLGQREDPSARGGSGRNDALDDLINALKSGPVEPTREIGESPATETSDPEAKPEENPQSPDSQDDSSEIA